MHIIRIGKPKLIIIIMGVAKGFSFFFFGGGGGGVEANLPTDISGKHLN